MLFTLNQIGKQMIDLKKSTAALAIAMLGGLSIASAADAACAVSKGVAVSQSEAAWPGNAYDEALRNAYSDGRCVITKGFHPGGTPCLKGASDNHITVATYTSGGNFKRTYHVFSYTLEDGSGIVRQCSTY